MVLLIHRLTIPHMTISTTSRSVWVFGPMTSEYHEVDIQIPISLDVLVIMWYYSSYARMHICTVTGLGHIREYEHTDYSFHNHPYHDQTLDGMDTHSG